MMTAAQHYSAAGAFPVESEAMHNSVIHAKLNNVGFLFCGFVCLFVFNINTLPVQESSF